MSTLSCFNCGHPNPTSKLICESCGTPLLPQTLDSDNEMKTQAIPSLDDLLREDRQAHQERLHGAGSVDEPEEDDFAPTEAIDFDAIAKMHPELAAHAERFAKPEPAASAAPAATPAPAEPEPMASVSVEPEPEPEPAPAPVAPSPAAPPPPEPVAASPLSAGAPSGGPSAAPESGGKSGKGILVVVGVVFLVVVCSGALTALNKFGVLPPSISKMLPGGDGEVQEPGPTSEE